MRKARKRRTAIEMAKIRDNKRSWDRLVNLWKESKRLERLGKVCYQAREEQDKE